MTLYKSCFHWLWIDVFVPDERKHWKPFHWSSREAQSRSWPMSAPDCSSSSTETFRGFTVEERWCFLNLILSLFSFLFALLSWMHQSKPAGFIQIGRRSASFLCLREGWSRVSSWYSGRWASGCQWSHFLKPFPPSCTPRPHPGPFTASP